MLLYKDELGYLKGCIRAGMIPYIKRPDGIYFLMGVDMKTKEFSDFGGGIKNNETPIQAALRELHEETRQLLTDIGEIKLGIYDRHNSTCVIFCEIDNSLFNTLPQTFLETTKLGDEYNEMSELVFLSTERMINLVYSENSKMWSRIRFALKNTGEFDDRLLRQL